MDRRKQVEDTVIKLKKAEVESYDNLLVHLRSTVPIPEYVLANLEAACLGRLHEIEQRQELIDMIRDRFLSKIDETKEQVH